MQILLLLAYLLLSYPLIYAAEPGSENAYNERFCAEMGGERETRHHYATEVGAAYISVDCETELTVIEGGLDKRSSLDSIHQALFASMLSGKVPGVVIYDTDGVEGAVEYQLRIVSKRLKVFYLRVPVGEMEEA